MPAPTGKSIPAQVLILLVATAVLASVAQYSLPKRIAWRQDWDNLVKDLAGEAGVRVVSLEETRAIIEQGAHLVFDARPNRDYLAGHIPGAFSLPHAEFDKYLPDVLPLLSAEQPILTYCSGASCDESVAVSVQLKQQGFTNIVLFEGGIAAWKKAGYKVQQ